MMRSILLVCASCVALAGCSSVTPRGLMAAARLDPLNTPPQDISVAVSVPAALRLRDGDAQLFLGYAPEDAADAAPVAATVPLSLAQVPGTPGGSDGTAVYAFELAPADAARVAEVQRRIRDMKAREIKGSGTFRVEVSGGCLTRPLGDTLPVATWLRARPEAAFVPLTRRTDIWPLLSAEARAALAAELVPC